MIQKINPQTTIRIKFLATAAKEVKEILRDTQREYGTKYAQNIRESLVTKTKELLTNTPYIGRPLYEYPEYAKKGIRRYLPHQHYSILYLVNDSVVEVWHVWDNRRDWTTLFDE